MILLDTSVVSDGIKPVPNPGVEAWIDGLEPQSVWISAITVAELRAGVEMMADGEKRSAVERAVDRALEQFGGLCLAFDALAAYEYARIVAARRRNGSPIEPLDAQIAAIALAAGCTLATLNTKDFEGIDGLKVVDPSLLRSP